jgi:outer membrane protein OmpA-like peptidoglycan-associated protein
MAIDDRNDDRVGAAGTETGTGEVHGMSTVRDAPEREGGLGWLPWLIGLLLLGLLLWWLLGRDADRDAVVIPTDEPTLSAAAPGTVEGRPAAVAYTTADFDRYLAGTEPVGRVFALDRVTFASGADTLDAQGRAELAELAGVLKRYPGARLALTGYADPAGDAAANQALSQRRAEAVRAALAEAGVAANVVSLEAAGETGSAAVRANRKVEARVTAR